MMESDKMIDVEMNAGKNGGIDTETALFSEAGASKPNQVLRIFPPGGKLRLGELMKNILC